MKNFKDYSKICFKIGLFCLALIVEPSLGKAFNNENYKSEAYYEKNCPELQTGQCRTVLMSRLESLAKKSANYKICKLPAKGEYSVYINFLFYDSKIFSGIGNKQIRKSLQKPGTKANKIHKQWVQKARSCVKKYKNFFVDPLGRKLILKLNEGGKIANVPALLVEVNSDRGKSLDVSWRKYIDCPTILHEIFHHLGLVDEYIVHKKLLPKTSRKSCRAIGHKWSLMRNSDALYNLDRYEFGLKLCKCSKAKNKDLSHCQLYGKYNQNMGTSFLDPLYEMTQQALMKRFYRSKNLNCPRGFKMIAKNIHINTLAKLTKRKYENSLYDLQRLLIDIYLDANRGLKEEKRGYLYLPILTKLKKSTQSKKFYVLDAAHLNSIIYPNCELRNYRYYQCAKNAYRSRENCSQIKFCQKPGAWTSVLAIDEFL